MISLAMRICAVRLLNAHMYFAFFFDTPTPTPPCSKPRFCIILFLPLWRITFQKESGGDVPSGWLGELIPVLFHGYYMDLSMNTEQSNPGSIQSFLIESVVEGGGDWEHDCLFIGNYSKILCKEILFVRCLLWWDLRSYFCLYISTGLSLLTLFTSFYSYSLETALCVKEFLLQQTLVMGNPG